MRTVASKVPFSDLCNVCERISNKPGKQKKEVLVSFLRQWRQFHDQLHKDDPNTTDSFYPAMRLLLPHLEKERLAYGIKEHTLAKLYIEVLCLSKDSEDAQKLLNYRAPKFAKSDAGDFATVAYFVLSTRCPGKGTLSVEDVNNCLDSIANNNAIKDKAEMKKSLLRLLCNLSAKEQKWLIRMIMKELKMGISENTVFSVYHPDAKDLFDVTSSLHKVCTMLKDPIIRLHEIEISLFNPFRPMLAEQASPDQIEKLMNNQSFYIETKYDGERFQLHKQGNKYMYFSRNCNDFTQHYGATPLEGSITPHIADSFKSDVKNCIIDGEMVGYNTKLNCIGSKGENFDVKNLQADDIYQPCLFVFDILLYNDEVLTNRPLKDRLPYLEVLFTPIEGRIQCTSQKVALTGQEVINSLNEAIDNHEEGIVIKNPDSVYYPNKRKGGWFKIKPEYVNNLMDELDLLIIGGYFGEGRRSGLISHFLLGVSASNKTDQNSVFHSFAKVGSGYSFQELYELLTKLSLHWKVYDKRNPPDNVILASGHKEKPDVWIEPSKSTVVQVKAAEIILSDRFKTGCTLRFPRVQKIRYDKSWDQCLTIAELEDVRKQASGKLATRLMSTQTDDEISPKKRRIISRLPRPTVAAHFQPANISNVEKISNFFDDLEFCVVTGPSAHPKQTLEKRIVECGGTIIQNPDNNTLCIIADKITLRVKNIIATKQYDVAKADWLLRCIEQSTLIPWTPADLWYATPSTTDKFAIDYDKYGDNYIRDISEEVLKSIFDSISEQEWKEDCVTGEQIAELEMEYFPNTSPFGLFRIFRIYIDDKTCIGSADTKILKHNLHIIELQLKLFGSTITEQIDNLTTHVITHTCDSSRVEDLQKLNKRRKKHFHLVTEKWAQECVKSNRLLDERPFQPISKNL